MSGDHETCPIDGASLEQLPTDPLLGTIFAERYEVLSIVGKGGMSTVYKAKHSLMKRIVAIKMLHTGTILQDNAFERFRQEGEAASSLQHPNIVAVHDFGIGTTESGDKKPFLVMDYLEGPTLSEILEKEGRVQFGRAIEIFKQVCDGLEHAHQKGIVHRDIKPSNLCLVKQQNSLETVKIVDFGIAKIMPKEGEERQQLTRTGESFGSPLFMSPEQCLGKPLDWRSDLYSFGCVMYKTLTGIPPFAGNSAFDTMTMHVSVKPRNMSAVLQSLDIPEPIASIVMKALEKLPEERYQSAAELRDALSAAGELISHSQKDAPITAPASTVIAHTTDTMPYHAQSTTEDDQHAYTFHIEQVSDTSTSMELNQVEHPPSKQSGSAMPAAATVQIVPGDEKRQSIELGSENFHLSNSEPLPQASEQVVTDPDPTISKPTTVSVTPKTQPSSSPTAPAAHPLQVLSSPARTLFSLLPNSKLTPIVLTTLACIMLFCFLGNHQSASTAFREQLRHPDRKLNTGLSYWLELQQSDENVRVNSKDGFKNNDRIKVHLKTDTDAYIRIVMQNGVNAQSSLLFPSNPDTAVRLPSDKEITFPPKNKWLKFDNERAVERLRIIVSRTELTNDMGMEASPDAVVISASFTESDEIPSNCLVEMNSETQSKPPTQKNLKVTSSIGGTEETTIVTKDTTKPLVTEIQLRHDR